ncbi:uncharacterized protein EURHEDRAFT_523843 [Aspergillus ruber CBS 135680]|uniref:F-box domain-containing protein n=1 Tax=Aspergillus ruber (strain CBS 135680) TaxID=1388766 RepID=A0A017SBG6_ASPRC|nr:uncharacterized protein EURHEDRAFT_523843 [Aspergillus ruber CBS 135680]EYE94388.1 hypothetical protein EURHEDRAFT_523843 [Aspergillus ruber CBS 135680]
MVFKIFNNPHFSPFSVLPVEVAKLITGYLGDKRDVYSLRLTCRDFYFITVDQFGHACLETVKTDLSKESLFRLAHLAQHHGLRGHVKRLSFTSPNGIFGGNLQWLRYPEGHLVLGQDAIQLLVDIMGCLHSCTSFQIKLDTMDEQDVYRDGFLTHSDIVNIFFNIIAYTGHPVKSLALDFHDGNVCNSINTRRLNLPALHKQRDFVSALAHMEELTLNCTMDSRVIVRLGLTLIQHALSLQKLRIHFDLFFGKEFMRYLTSIYISGQLHELSLERSVVSGDNLLAVLCRVPQLRVLSLKQLRLSEDSSIGWHTVLQALLTRLPYLDCIELGSLLQGCAPETYSPKEASFPRVFGHPSAGAGFSGKVYLGTLDPDSAAPMEMHYSGPCMDRALQATIDMVTIF